MPLSRYVAGFPRPPALHPFEEALLDLTVGVKTYTAVLSRVDALRKALQEVNEQCVTTIVCTDVVYHSCVRVAMPVPIQHSTEVLACNAVLQLEAVCAGAVLFGAMAGCELTSTAVPQVGKSYAHRAANAANKREATAVAEEGVDIMEKVMHQSLEQSIFQMCPVPVRLTTTCFPLSLSCCYGWQCKLRFMLV